MNNPATPPGDITNQGATPNQQENPSAPPQQQQITPQNLSDPPSPALLPTTRSEVALVNPLDPDENLRHVGNLAADYLEGFLDICDLDGDIKISVSEDRLSISVDDGTDGSNSDLSALSDPDAVKALRDLMVMYVRKHTQKYSKITLSIGRSSEIKEQALRNLVQDAIVKLEAGATRVRMPNMCSYDRRIIHKIVSKTHYKSKSQGFEPDRHVVLYLPPDKTSM